MPDTFLDWILNFFKTYFNQMSLAELPVTPMMFLLKFLRYSFMAWGVSLSGSREMKTILSLRYAPSGKFLMILYIEERQKRVLGLISGQLVYPKQTRQQYPDSIWLEKGQPQLLTKVQSPPTSDSFYLTSVNPLISSQKQSICSLFFKSALQTIQINPLANTAKPIMPTLLTPSQDFCYYSERGEELNDFCYCIIHASSLLRGIRSVAKVQRHCCCRGRLTLCIIVLRRGLVLVDWVSSLWRERALNIVYNVN